MKKIIAFLLVMVMCIGLFAGCGNDTTEPTTGNTQAPTDATQATEDTGSSEKALNNAKSYIRTMYIGDDGSSTKRDYNLMAVVSINGTTYPVEWSVEVTSGDASCLEVVNDGTTATVKILNNAPAEEVQYNLIATISDGTNSVSVSFKHNIPAAEATGVVFTKEPAVGTAYKFALEQGNVGSTLYFTGNMSGYYMESTENPFEAADVYLEEADGGLRVYFMDGETKTYIDLVPREDNAEKANIKLTAEPTCVYTWDAERGTLVAVLGEHSFYIGTYSEYTTFSVSNFSYIEDASVIGTSQFPSGFCTVNIAPTKVKEPAAGTAYKLLLEQGNIGANLYFTGEMSGYYMASTQNPGEAVDVYLEEVDGGLRLYFLQGEKKIYIDLVLREGYTDKANIILTETPAAVYTWDADRGTLVAQLGEAKFYIGTYSEYTTFSVSNFSYIEDASVVGVSQFPAGFCTVEGFMGVTLPEGGEDEPVEDPDDGDNTTGSDPAADSKLSISEAIALGSSKDHDTYTDGKYYVTGVITEVYNTTYGNMYLTDGEGNTLTIYGTFDATGANRYDAMENAPVAGDTVTIYGKIGQYNGTPQIKNGWIITEGDSGSSDTGSSDVTVNADYATSVEAGVAYKLALYSTAKEATYYLAGGMNGYYMATTTAVEESVDVYLENAEGGYYMYYLDGETKVYIDVVPSGTHINAVQVAEPGVVYTWNAEYNTLTAAVEGNDYYLGTYGDYVTMGPSKLSYAATSYVAHFFAVE